MARNRHRTPRCVVMSIALAGALVAGTAATATAATTVQLPPATDCSITESVTSAQCAQSSLTVGQVPVKRLVCSDTCTWVTTWHRSHALLRFDLNEQLPPGAEIVSATLAMHLASGGINGLVDVSAVQRIWTTAVTWSQYDTGAPWTTPGGDLEPAISSVTPSTPGTTYRWDVTSLAREWRAGTYGETGVMLTGRDELDLNRTATFDATESAASSARPVLEVTYQADSEAPDVDIEGVVYEDRDAVLPRDLYRLSIDAEDVASGVADTRVLVDGTPVFDRSQTCPQGGCDMEVEDAPVDARTITGVHRIDVAVTDVAGHVQTVTWTVEFNGDPVDPNADQPLAATAVFPAGCPDATAALAARPDAATPMQVRRGAWRTASGASGGETTAFYSGGAYRVTRCGADGELVDSQLVVTIRLRGLGPARFLLAETRPVGIAGEYHGTVGLLPAGDDPQLIKWWRNGGAAQMAKRVIPPTS